MSEPMLLARGRLAVSTLALLVCTLAVAPHMSLAQGVRGKDPKGPGVAVARRAGLPADARILTPKEFRESDILVRRRVMAAWGIVQPGNEGLPLLEMIEAGIRDADVEVRRLSLSLVTRLGGAANLASLKGLSVGTDPRTSASLYDAVRNSLGDPDWTVRSHAATALTGFYVPPRLELEVDFLARLRLEPKDAVRARLIRGLGERAKVGSTVALEAVIAALDDPSSIVRSSALTAMFTMAMRGKKVSDALPQIVREVYSQDASVRLLAVQALEPFGGDARMYLSTLEVRMNLEHDPRVRAALRRLIERIR